MRNALRLAVALTGASIFGACVLLACSDDTSVNASTEAGVTPVPEAGSDSPISTDGGADTSTPFDGGFQVDTFDTVLSDAVCQSLARCCWGNPFPADGGADGGSFDVATCKSMVLPFGFEGSNAGTELRDAGHVAVDQVAADNCIKKVKAMTCNLPGTEFTQIRSACFAAYAGKLDVGAPCSGSIECKPGSFCKTGASGTGTGTCAALRAVNGACGDFTTDPAVAEEACSYRRGGDTGNHCKSFDFAGSGALDAGDWKCAPGVGVGADCKVGWCTDAVCEFNQKCTTPDMYWATSCDFFVK